MAEKLRAQRRKDSNEIGGWSGMRLSVCRREERARCRFCSEDGGCGMVSRLNTEPGRENKSDAGRKEKRERETEKKSVYDEAPESTDEISSREFN